jgi:hypothetical protein
MSGNQEGRAPAELCSLEQAIIWIETPAGVPEHPIQRRITPATVQELHEALKAGMITASGCVDGGERRDISQGEWNDYRLKLEHAAFADHHFMGTVGTPIIAVLSIRSFPAAALKYHGCPSGVRIPSAYAQDGEPGYHRVITDVLLRREQVLRQWPSGDRAVPTFKGRSTDLSRTRPARERAQRALSEIYPEGVPSQAEVPNKSLCSLVCAKLKDSGLPKVSDATILRAAGRLK